MQTKMKRSAREALLLEGDVREKAAEAGLRLRVALVTGKTRKKRRPTETFHWMFDDLPSGRRVLDYWPGTGTWRGGGQKGSARDPWEAMEEAKKAAGRPRD
jgi:hypothetical protein